MAQRGAEPLGIHTCEKSSQLHVADNRKSGKSGRLQGGFFGKILDILKNVLTLHSQSRCYGRVVRQWSAKPCTAVRFCLAPLPWMKPPKRDFEAAYFLLQSYGLSEAAQVAVAAYLVDDARDDSVQRLVVAVVGRRHEVYPFLAEKFPGSPFFLPV